MMQTTVPRDWPVPRSSEIGSAILAVAAILVVLVSTRWGIGTSVDSVAYVQGARALVGERGEPGLVQHAPFYSVLLASWALAGVDPIQGARWLNAFTFGINVALVGALIRQSTVNVWWLGAAGSLLMLVNPGMVTLHLTALSEPVFLTLLLAGFWAVASYLIQPSLARLAGSAVLAGFALLARYAGASVVLAGALAIMAMDQAPLYRRFRSAVVFGVVASAPIALWMARNTVVAGSATGRELSFHPVGLAHAWQALYTASGWLLIPMWAPNAVRLAVCGLGAALAVAAGRRATKGSGSVPVLIRVVALFFVAYSLFLTVSISFVDANTPLDDRILSPIFASSLILGAYVVDTLWPSFARRRVLVYAIAASVAIFAGGHAVKAAEIAVTSYKEGWGFTSSAWRGSAVLTELATRRGDLLVYSNAPEIVYLHAHRVARGLPRTRYLMTQQVNHAFDAELARVAAEIRESCGVLVYVRNLSQKTMAGEREIGAQVSLDVLADTADGIIWGVHTCPR